MINYLKIFSDDPYGKATVWQIKDESFGLVEVKGGTVQDPFRFFALFHIDQVIVFENGWDSGKWHGQPFYHIVLL